MMAQLAEGSMLHESMRTYLRTVRLEPVYQDSLTHSSLSVSAQGVFDFSNSLLEITPCSSSCQRQDRNIHSRLLYQIPPRCTPTIV